jgi:tetratricopeptide (TPR) repeat protein
VARDLEALGVNKYFLGELDQAHDLVSQALAIRLQIEGPLSPNVAGDRNTLAAIAHDRGDLRSAERLYRDNLAADEKVLGPQHPDLAISLNNLGRVLLVQRRFRDAETLLKRAVQISMKERGADHDDMAFLFSNLALAKQYLGKPDEARSLFERALAVARLRQHPFLGAILADAAGLGCVSGRSASGLRDIAEAAPLVEANFPGSAWRAAWVENVRGECLLASDRATGAALIRKSAPVVLKRWGRETLFGFEATRRAAALGVGTVPQ